MALDEFRDRITTINLGPTGLCPSWDRVEMTSRCRFFGTFNRNHVLSRSRMDTRSQKNKKKNTRTGGLTFVCEQLSFSVIARSVSTMKKSNSERLTRQGFY
jgi:hypothetical protein